MNRIIIAMLAAAAGIGYYFWSSGEPATGSALVLNGNVDIRSVNVSSRVAGRLQQLVVDEGAAVKPGDTLGLLDAQPYEIALRQAEAEAAATQESIVAAESNERAAQAALNLLLAGFRQEDKDRARAELAVQEVVLANVQKEFTRQQVLLSSKAVSQQSYDNAEKAFRAQVKVVEAYRAALQLAESGYRQEEKEKATAQLEAARAAVTETRARHVAALVRVEQAQLNLADTQLVAPAEGIVTTRIVEPGSMLAAGAPVVSIALRSPIRVRAYVDEMYLDRVRLGMPVEVTTDGGTTCRGTVFYVSPQAEFTPKTVQTVDLRTSLVYRILITLESGAEHLNAGAPVSVSIQ